MHNEIKLIIIITIIMIHTLKHKLCYKQREMTFKKTKKYFSGC